MFQKPKPKPWYLRWSGTLAGVTAIGAAVVAFSNMSTDIWKIVTNYLPYNLARSIAGTNAYKAEIAVSSILDKRYVSEKHIIQTFGEPISSHKKESSGAKLSTQYYDGPNGQFSIIYRNDKIVSWSYASDNFVRGIDDLVKGEGLDYKFSLKELAVHQPKRQIRIFDGSRSQEYSVVQLHSSSVYRNELFIFWYIFSPRSACFKNKPPGFRVELTDKICADDLSEGKLQVVEKVYDLEGISIDERNDIEKADTFYSVRTSEFDDVILSPLGARMKKYRPY